MKFGASIYSISRKILSNEITPEEGVTWLGENGAEVIEIVPFGIDIINTKGLTDCLLKAAEKANTSIANYSLNANFLRISDIEYNDEINRVKSHIDAAAILGVPTIRIDCAGYRLPVVDNTTENFQKELPLVLDTYKRLCEYAGSYNLTVLLENHGFHLNGSERVRQILTSMDCEIGLGHQLDTGNFLCTDDCAIAAVKKLIDFATTIHMKDFYIRTKDPGDATEFDCSGSWFRSVAGKYLRGSILGQGDLDIIEIINQIKKSQFNGNIFIEFEGMEDCLYGTKVSLDNLKRIWG